MKFAVFVSFRNGQAHYTITQVGEGVFHAQLEQFHGAPEEAPPAKVVLTKSFRCWKGSCEDQNLLNHLGQAIEEKHSNPISSLKYNRS
jgi:hypothetical protein